MSSANQKMMKYFVVLLMVLTCNQVTTEKIECYFDGVCDNLQYCNKDEERCSYCICEPQPVIPECLEICAKKMVTKEMVTTEMAKTANLSLGNITESQYKDNGDNTNMNARAVFLINFVYVPVSFALIIGSYLIGRYLTVRRKCCFERSSAKPNLLSDDVVIQMDDLPNGKKAKLPIEERGHEQFEDSCNKIHTSPTDDNDAERHKLMIGPNGYPILQNKCQQDDATLLKQPFLN